MKKHLFICFTAVIFFSKSYGQNYVPMLEQGKLWDEFYQLNLWNNPQCSLGPYCGGYRYSIAGDSIINGLNYKKLSTQVFYQANLSWPFVPPYSLNPPTPPPGIASLREDTLNRIVYQYNSSGNDDTLYNFNLSIGDSLKLINVLSGSYIILDSITSYVLENGQQTRKQYFHPDASLMGIGCFEYSIIEGIGGLSGLLNPVMVCFEAGNELTCVKDINGVSLYSSGGCTQILNVASLNAIPEIQVYYDNAESKIIIENAMLISDYYNLDLYDLNGKLIFESGIATKENKLYVPIKKNLCTGIYICKLFGNQKQVICKLSITN